MRRVMHLFCLAAAGLMVLFSAGPFLVGDWKTGVSLLAYAAVLWWCADVWKPEVRR